MSCIYQIPTLLKAFKLFLLFFDAIIQFLIDQQLFIPRMVVLERALALFRPFAGVVTGNTMAIQVRNNCPWHRNNFRPCYFPFRMHKRLTRHSMERRLRDEAGRHILMRKLLGENHYITWNWPSKKADRRRLSFPF